MKKPAPWQIVLLVIFYPVGIIYLILYMKSKKDNRAVENGNNKLKINTSELGIARDMHTKVVGVTFGNDDGSNRQKIISKCRVGESVIFKHTPSPEYPEAIGIFTENGKQLGNVNANLASELIHRYPNNPMKVTISDITGGKNGKNYGCNLHLIIYNNV